jgi:hypothetical protein
MVMQKVRDRAGTAIENRRGDTGHLARDVAMGKRIAAPADRAIRPSPSSTVEPRPIRGQFGQICLDMRLQLAARQQAMMAREIAPRASGKGRPRG